MSKQTNICGYHVAFDPTTSSPLHYASLILKYVVPKDFVWDQNLKKIIEFDNFRISYGDKATREENIRYAGSSVEGIVIPKFHSSNGFVEPDIDKLILQCNTFYFPLPFEHAEYSSGQIFESRPAKDAPPNYAYLVPTEQFKRARCLSGNPVQTTLVSNLICKKATFDALKGQPLTVHGPAVTSDLGGGSEIDNVPVFSFPGWPSVARDFAVRKRKSGWPTEQMLRNILVSGFYLAGVGRRGTKMEEFEWRYSFNSGDKILAHSFTKQQRQVYVYLKLIRTFYLKQPGIFPSYWMKTMFFWICEKISPRLFSSNNLGKILHYIFDEMIHILSTRHLANYWISSVNMLAMTPRDHLKTTLKRVRYVKSNLIGCILHIDSQINFIQMSRMSHEKISHLLSSSIESMTKSPHDTTLFQSSATEGLKNVLAYYLKKCKELEIYTEDMFLVRDALRNSFVALIGEVLEDLQQFCRCGSPDTLDLIHVLEKSNDANVAAKVLVLLEIKGDKSKLELAKQTLPDRIENLLNSGERSLNEKQNLTEVKVAISTLNGNHFKHFENEVVYKLISIHDFDSVPVSLPVKTACRQM